MATVNILPNAEGDVQEWDPYPASARTHYELVDDPVGNPDEDSTYVYTGVDGEIEDFEHETSDLLARVIITNVRLLARARKTGALDDVGIVLGLRICGTRYSSGITAILSTSYADKTYDWANNPADGQAWGKSDIDDLQSSLESAIGIGIAPELRCTQVYLIVTYTTVAPRKPRPTATVGLPHII